MTHTGEKPHQCNQCHFSLIMADQLKKHKRIHSSETTWQPDNLFYFALLAIKSFMSQHANIFDPQIENTYCVFLENKFQQRELRFLLRKVILVERRNTTFRATITIWFILAKVSIFHGSSPYTQDAETGQVVAFWIVHKDQVISDIEVCLQSNCAH